VGPFGTFFRKGGEVTLYRIEEPSGIFKEGTKISIGKFLEAIPPGKLTKLTGPSITQLVRKWS